jgi:hypothetical protein
MRAPPRTSSTESPLRFLDLPAPLIISDSSSPLLPPLMSLQAGSPYHYQPPRDGTVALAAAPVEL